MPVPTDTYWNIRRLNTLFAVSAVLLVLVTLWAILQDWNRDWKGPQRSARVWEAALVSEKIERDLTAEKQQQAERLRKEIAEQQAKLQSQDEQFRALQERIHKTESDRSTLEFRLNNQKAVVGVAEANLQDAIAAGDEQKASRLRAEIEEPRRQVREWSEQLASMTEEIKQARAELATLTADIDARQRQLAKLTGDAELLEKKLASLQPDGLLATVAHQVRSAPLLSFINPPERVRQVVLPDVQTDVSFMKITTIDRCITCHVNIEKKDFTEENVLAYLEERASAAKGLRLPQKAGGKAADPAATASKPGAVAMAPFWHAWARTLAPELIRKNNTRIGAIARLTGKDKPAQVTYDGQPVSEFKFDPSASDPAAVRQQDAILIALLEAAYQWEKPADPAQAKPIVVRHDKAQVELNPVGDERAITTARNSGMRYVEELRNGLQATLPHAEFEQLEERYRHALVALVNPARRQQKLPALDPSPVLLAHPKLDLYVGVDSKHSFEAVGCTSCHDGSGQETDFVLAAHVPKDIYVDARTGVPVLPQQLEQRPKADHDSRLDLASMLDAAYPEDAVLPVGLDQPHLPAPETHAHAEPGPAAHAEPGPAAHAEPGSTAHAPQGGPIEYVDPVTGAKGKAIPQMRRWEQVYEPIAPRSFKLVYHEWDTPMRPAKYLQASCVRCHTDAYDIKEEAPVINHGRELFVQNGCVNCHQMDSIPAHENRKVGTDLRHVTAKLSPAMINTWVWAPKAFRPSTKMPHFFMLENNSSGEEIRRTTQEARAITEYLVRTATPLQPRFPLPQGAHGSAEAGRLVFNSVGCLACHANLNDPTGEQRKLADGKTKPVTLGEKWIVNDLTKQADFVEQLAQKLGKAPAANDLKQAATEAYEGMTYNERQQYVIRHMEVDPGRGEAPKYADGSPKPQFIHVGPELSGIGTKLTAGRTPEQARQWLYDWLKDPRHYSDYTIMPSLRLSDQQALDLAAYLLDQKRTADDPDDTWEAHLTAPDTPKLIELTAFFLRSRYSPAKAVEKAQDEAELTAMAADALTSRVVLADEAKKQAATLSSDEKRMVFLGKKLIGHYGCMSCHQINGTEEIASACTNLSDWGQKGVDKLDFGYLTEHAIHKLPPTTEVPIINGLSAKATHLLRPGGASGDSSVASADPSAAPASTAIAPQALNVAWIPIDHKRTDWLTQKLKNTRIYDRGRALLEPDPTRKTAEGLLEEPGKPYDKIKMPTFYLRDEQVDAIVTFVISNRDRLISDRLTARAVTPQAKQIARGRELVHRYNCVSCHVVEKNAPQVHQYYKPDDVITRAPPSIRGEGNKIQPAWLFNFFRHVEPLRPLLAEGIRMPSFHATDEEWTAIIDYFAAVSRKESERLKRELDPVLKYVAAERQKAEQDGSDPTTQPDGPWPGDDWSTRPEFAATARFLKDWSLGLGQMRDIQFDPARNSPQELAKSYRTALFKARFVMRLFDTPYPFVDGSRLEIDDSRANAGDRSAITQARFKLGEQLFYEMQCLKCHVLGDPAVPGAQKNPTAPNLSLTHRRLQRRWVRHWVQEPGIIQVGTAMPPFLTGLSIFDLNGMAWPKSQGSAEAEVKRVEQTYGDTPDEQADLVLDFLYAAGVEGYTGIQPESASGATPAQSGTPSAATEPVPTTVPTTAPSSLPAR